MSTLREAAQQALEALEEYQSKGAPFLACDGAVAALRAALAQQDEPVTKDMKSAVRWAPSSAYWSQQLRGLFGPDAREGIDALERRLAEAQQAEPVEPVACGWVGDPSMQDYASTQPEPAKGAWHDGVLEGQLRERERWLAQQDEPDAYGYASRLAVAIWEKHYKDTAPQWKPLDYLIGVLTQIDNMTSGLTRQAQQAEPAQEPVAWIQPDHLQKARIAPFLCRVEPTQRCADFVPLYLAPPQRKPLTDEVATLIAQRDALLEALKDATKTIEHLGYPLAAIERARAAIKAVEGEKA